MLEAHAVRRSLKKGWKPEADRLCSCDGGRYGLLGSTEWAEEYRAS